MRVAAESVRFEAERCGPGFPTGREIGVVGVVPAFGGRRRDGAAGLRDQLAGVHWEVLNEDVSVEGLLAGSGARGRIGRESA